MHRAAGTPLAGVYELLDTTPSGLSGAEAARRLSEHGANRLETGTRSVWAIAREQAASGINALMAGAALLTAAVGGVTDGAIIVSLLAVNVAVGLLQELHAERALSRLSALLTLRAQAWRDGVETAVLLPDLVPGDLVSVRSGDVVPADLRVVDAARLEVNEATLTGRSRPQPKAPVPVSSSDPARWTSILFAGTVVTSGRGRGVVVATGRATQYGATAALSGLSRTPSAFQVHLTRFARALVRVAFGLALLILLANVVAGRGLVESLTLAAALALGTVPEALPAVTAATVALGAARLAQRKILVRRLSSVEDLSVVDTLCLGKTGTITENRTVLAGVWTRLSSAELLGSALACSSVGAGYVEDAVREAAGSMNLDLSEAPRAWPAPDDPPGDAAQVSYVVAEQGGGTELLCLGEPSVLMPLCTRLRTADGDVALTTHGAAVVEAVRTLEQRATHLVAVGARPVTASGTAALTGPADLSLVGVLALRDPTRSGARAALARIESLQVEEKILTADTLPQAVSLARDLGWRLPPGALVSARDLPHDDLPALAERGRILCDVTPTGKQRLVEALRRSGRHVAVTGEGVNDAAALQAADVGIALAGGSDAARTAAGLILLEDDLGAIADGIEEGRRTFTNINRYLLYTMVSNVANVLVIALGSLLLGFLPLRPAQVLLLTLLPDLPMLLVVTDRVAGRDLAVPGEWSIARVMAPALSFGVLNAAFAFGLLGTLVHQPASTVQSAWFLFLGTTALLVFFAVRHRGWAWDPPRPSPLLLTAIGAALVATVAFVNLPPAQRLLGFASLPWRTQLGILAYSLGFVLVVDVLRHAAGLRRRSGPARR